MASKVGLIKISEFMKVFKMVFLGMCFVHLCAIMHEIIRFFILVNFSIYLGAFQMKSEVCKLRLFETIQNRYMK